MEPTSDESNNPLFDQCDSRVPLETKPSERPENGMCLVALDDVQTTEDIFSKPLLLAMPDTEHFEFTCDNCFLWLGSTIDGQGRMYGPGDRPDSFKRCSGCKTVRYCKVK